MEYVLLVVGFILLIKGADFFVEGSSSLAQIQCCDWSYHCCNGNERTGSLRQH